MEQLLEEPHINGAPIFQFTICVDLAELKLLQAANLLESLDLYFEGAHGSVVDDVLQRLASGSLNASYSEPQSPHCDHATESESFAMLLPHLRSLKIVGIRTHRFPWAFLPEILFARRNLRQLHIHFHCGVGPFQIKTWKGVSALVDSRRGC